MLGIALAAAIFACASVATAYRITSRLGRDDSLAVAPPLAPEIEARSALGSAARAVAE